MIDDKEWEEFSEWYKEKWGHYPTCRNDLEAFLGWREVRDNYNNQH